MSPQHKAPCLVGFSPWEEGRAWWGLPWWPDERELSWAGTQVGCDLAPSCRFG